MDGYQTLIAASAVCIRQSGGNTYIYIKDAIGKIACHTVIGDVVVTRGKLEVISRVDAVEYDVAFPGDE